MKLLLVAMMLSVVLMCIVCGKETDQGSRSVRSPKEWDDAPPINGWENDKYTEGSGDTDDEDYVPIVLDEKGKPTLNDYEDYEDYGDYEDY